MGENASMCLDFTMNKNNVNQKCSFMNKKEGKWLIQTHISNICICLNHKVESGGTCSLLLSWSCKVVYKM